MEQMDVRVSFYLKKSETNADGCCPVMARLTVGNHSEAAFSAKMSVPVSSWASGRATGKSAATREINRQLDELRASALAIYKEQSAIREDVTAEEVRDLLLGKASGQTTLLNYFQTFIEHFEKRVGVNREKDTLRSYRYARNCISAFLQTQYKLSDIPFTALDRSFIDRYDLYLRTERRIAPGTIVLLTSKLNMMFQLITIDNNTAGGYHHGRPVRRVRTETPRKSAEIPHCRRIASADDHAASSPDALPSPRPVPILVLYGHSLRGYVPPERR